MSTAKRIVGAALVVIAMIAAAVTLGSGSASAYCPGCTPHIQLSQSSGLTGDSITVDGTGFSDNSTAALSFHSTFVSLGSVATSSTGTFATTITIPSVSVGSHEVLATDGVTGNTARAFFTVTGSGTAGTGGGLAGTGVAVLGIASLGLVLLVGGGLMLLAGRRRKVAA